MEISELEKMHRLYSLRVAIACVLGTLPVEQQARAKAAMNQHVLAIEEADQTGLPGAAALAQVMTEEFECLGRAAAVMPTFVRPASMELAPVKATAGRRKKST